MMSPRSLGRPARAALSAALLAAAVLLPSVEEGRAQAPPPGAIAGTIGFEGSASPPAGASVAVYRGLGEEISRVRVSAESAWQFLAGNLPPGTYKILVTPDPALLPSECYAPLWHGAATSWHQAAGIEVASGRTIPGADVRLKVGGRISGTISFAEGGARPDLIAVRLHAAFGYPERREVWPAGCTETGCAYAFYGIPAGSYRLEFAPTGGDYAARWYDDKPGRESADFVSVAWGEETADADVRLERAGRIAGTVSFAPGGTLPSRVLIEVSEREGLPGARAQTDASRGWEYETAGLPQGAYRVRFLPEGNDTDYARLWHGDTPDFRSAQPVSLQWGAAVSGVDVRLPVGGAIAGSVSLAPGGTPPDHGVLVSAFDVEDHWVDDLPVLPGREYRLGQLPPGSYKVRFLPQNAPAGSYAEEWHDGASAAERAALVAVSPGSTTAGVDGHLEVGGAIAGTVSFGHGGGPPDWVAVQAHAPEGSEGDMWTPLRPDRRGKVAMTWTRSSEGWSYRVEGLPAGPFKLLAYPNEPPFAVEWHRDRPAKADADPVSVSWGRTSSVDVGLSVGGGIAGRILFEEGGSRPHQVRVEHFDGDGRRLGETLAYAVLDWEYRVEGLRPGTYHLRFVPEEGSGYAAGWHREGTTFADSTPVGVAAGSVVGNADVSLRRGGSVAGRIAFADGGELPDWVDVSAHDAAGAPLAQARADAAHGWDYRIGGLPAGSARIRFSPSGGDYVGQWHLGRPDHGSADPIAVTAGETSDGVDALLALGGTIAGAVSFAEGGTPPEAVEVSACDDAGRALRTARSDLRSGWTYRLAPLEEGAYKVSFSPVGGGWLPAWYDQASDAPAADPVAVTSGQVTPGVDARLEAAGATAGPIFADDFSDGNRVGDPSWIEAGGEWSALPDASGGGRLFSSSLGRNVAVVRELDPVTKPFTAGELEVAMRLTGSHRDAQVPNAALVFGYLDPGRYRYVRVTPGRIQIGQRGERGSDAAGIRATVPCRALRVGRWLRLRVVAHPDGGVTVRLGDAEVASARFDAAAPGGVGLAATRAVSHFAGFAVRPSPAPPGGPSPRR